MSTGIIPVIKQAALDAIDASKPVEFVYGTVIGVDPLRIRVNPELILNAETGVLRLTRNVTNYTVTADTEFDNLIEGATIPNGTYPLTINNALEIDEVVIMARMRGGQSYIVLDRMV